MTQTDPVPPAPVAELLDLPPEYGRPEAPLEWEAVRGRLVAASHCWLVTVRPDGRPHVRPVDGLWLDDAGWFGGSAETVSQAPQPHGRSARRAAPGGRDQRGHRRGNLPGGVCGW